jgi:hypothetical protein
LSGSASQKVLSCGEGNGRLLSTGDGHVQVLGLLFAFVKVSNLGPGHAIGKLDVGVAGITGLTRCSKVHLLLEFPSVDLISSIETLEGGVSNVIVTSEVLISNIGDGDWISALTDDTVCARTTFGPCLNNSLVDRFSI